MARKAAANIDPQAKPPEPAPEINEPVEITIESEAPETAIETQPESTKGVESREDRTAAPTRDTGVPSEGATATQEEKETPREIALRQRLAEMENADRLNKQNQEELNKKLAEANRQRNESARREFDAQMDSINNSIGAAQSIIESAATELEAAGNSGDWKAIAEINGRAARANAQLERLEYQKGLMEQRLEQSKRQQPQQQPPQRQQQPQPQPQRPMTAEEIIGNAPIPDRAKNWLRQHPEYITDPAKNKVIQGAHDIATYQAGGEFNDGYFERLESLLGIQKHARNGSAGPPVSAPPTREAPSMATGTAPKSTVVKLTPDQREIAAQIRHSYGDDKMTQAEAERIYAKELLKQRKE